MATASSAAYRLMIPKTGMSGIGPDAAVREEPNKWHVSGGEAPATGTAGFDSCQIGDRGF